MLPQQVQGNRQKKAMRQTWADAEWGVGMKVAALRLPLAQSKLSSSFWTNDSLPPLDHHWLYQLAPGQWTSWLEASCGQTLDIVNEIGWCDWSAVWPSLVQSMWLKVLVIGRKMTKCSHWESEIFTGKSMCSTLSWRESNGEILLQVTQA